MRSHRTSPLRVGSALSLLLISLAAFSCANTRQDDGGDQFTADSGGDTTLGGDYGLADPAGGFGGDGVALDTSSKPDISADAFGADDPPPKSCGDSGVVPIAPGGTPECPDDKNRE